jgi:hypothetical protein
MKKTFKAWSKQDKDLDFFYLRVTILMKGYTTT